MSFQFVPNSVTLDDLERRNSPNRRVISPNSVASGSDNIKVVEDTPILLHWDHELDFLNYAISTAANSQTKLLVMHNTCCVY